MECNITDSENYSNSQLHLAIASGENVERVIKCGANINVTNEELLTPLHIAALSGRLDVIQLLINKGANVFTKDKKDCTFLHTFFNNKAVIVANGILEDFINLLVSKNFTSLFNVTCGKYGKMPLHLATGNKKIPPIPEISLELLKKNNVNIFSVDNMGDSILLYAIFGLRSTDYLSKLIRLGADWKHLNNNQEGLLHLAAIFATVETSKYFLKLGLNINAIDKFGYTPLHLAVLNHWGTQNDIEVIHFLIKNSAEINAINAMLDTPLFLICYRQLTKPEDKLKIIIHLINLNADVYWKNYGDMTFLHKILLESSCLSPLTISALSQFLVNKQYSRIFNIGGGTNKFTPLQGLVQRMEVDFPTLNILHKSRVQFNAIDKQGDSTIYYALKGNRSLNFLSRLVTSFGANVWHLNNKNQSLLYVAAEFNHVEGLKYFLNNGLSPHAVDENGNTPLHCAVKFGENEKILEMTKALIEKNADAKRTNNEGKTPLDIAIERGNLTNKEEIKILLTN